MIYICIPCRNDATTVGLLLWKVRQVMGENQRHYQVLVGEDGSTDDTRQVLKRYEGVLPMVVLESDQPHGYAATVERLFRTVLEKSDRAKRDCAVILNGDFSVSPSVVPELIKRVESGADLVVAESTTLGGGRLSRWVARLAPKLLKPGVQVPGVDDLLSGVACIRLVTLKRCFDAHKDGIVLVTEGTVARAELIARAASFARQIQSVPIPEGDRRPSSEDPHPLSVALHLFRAGRTLNIPRAPQAVEQS